MSRKYLGNSYDKNLNTSYKILDPIKRIRSSSAYGHDIWNAYEFTHLDKKNLPVLKVLEITIPADSKFIVESKSLKIYLNSFYDKKFVNNSDVLNHIKNDLNKLTKSITKVRFLNKFLKKLNIYNTKYFLIKFIIKFLKKDFKDSTKIKFFNKYIRITYPAKNNEKLKKDFNIFRKNIKIYYEFPPITKFNYKKRFKKILNV